MKRHLFLSLILAALLAPSTVVASEVVHAFTSHIEINKNGSADVQEEIVYDFGSEEKHGILREIPLLYKSASDEFSHNVEITSISVTDGHNHTLVAQYDQEGSGNVAVIKIGDPEILLTGTQFYVIRYTLWGAVDSGVSSDKFTYDVSGSTIEAPIEKVRAEIQLPGEFSFTTLNLSCMRGTPEAGRPCTSTSSVGIASSSAHLLRYEDGSLAPGEQMLISLSLPKGTVIYQKKASDKLIKGTVAHSGIYRWWQKPFLDFTLVIPFLIFAAMMSILVSEKRGESVKRPQRVGRGAYFITGLVLVGISFYIPALNLALLLSGIVISLFSLFFEKNTKDA